MQLVKADIFKNLKDDILRLQGLKSSENPAMMGALGPMAESFPNHTFPVGSVHEFLSPRIEDVAATIGFVSGLLSILMGDNGAVLWISSSRKLFPPGLKNFSISPERFVFVDSRKEKEVLWAMDESLKCGALSAVVGELSDISFTASRRLQLAVEQSQVTGFILNCNQRRLNTTACVARWKITALPSEVIGELPGISFSKWKVELQRIRNGQPGSWDIQWTKKGFRHVRKTVATPSVHLEKAG